MPAPIAPTLSRRALLGWLAATGATTVLAACSGAPSVFSSAATGDEPTTAAAASTALAAARTQTLHRLSWSGCKMRRRRA